MYYLKIIVYREDWYNFMLVEELQEMWLDMRPAHLKEE